MDPASTINEPASTDDTNDIVLIDLCASDVTLISCDNAKFRIHQRTLSIASPFFEGMFNLATSSAPTVEIPMAESASVLETLIRFLYPVSPRAELITIDQARPVLQAAQKLELNSVESDIRRLMRDMLAEDSNPLRAWALAISCDEETSRQSAMLRFLCVNDDQLPTLVAQAVEELQYVSGKNYVQLLQWRVDAIKEAREINMANAGTLCRQHLPMNNPPARPLSDVCVGINPFALRDCPNTVLHAWLKLAAGAFYPCACGSSLFNLSGSVANLLTELHLVINRAKGLQLSPRLNILVSLNTNDIAM